MALVVIVDGGSGRCGRYRHRFEWIRAVVIVWLGVVVVGGLGRT